MVSEIQKVAVLGSGVMGCGIAAHFANAGIPVLLLDIVPDGAEDRNMLAKGAIEKALKTKPAPFTHKKRAKLITPGNLEDDLDTLAEVDWIIEVVLERLDVKQDVYRKIDAKRKPGSIVSSNTSTLPLHALVEGMPESFRKDFMITHFFNPPRYMRLLELVGGPDTRPDVLELIRQTVDVRLGKGVVDCKDTPGFIANRIGIFWLMTGLLEAIRLGISVEDADAVMGKPVGIPRTGVFGLFDLIGIDLMPLIAQAMMATLPKDDLFRELYEEPELVKKMIADGYTGRKGKGGFYRLNKEGGKKVKEALNLSTGEYAVAAKSKLGSVSAAKAGLNALVTHPDIGGQYAWAVLSKTLAYAASLMPEIADDILAVDDAMRMGYSWKYGPFELIDRLKTEDQAGPAWLAAKLAETGETVPDVLTKAGNGPLYRKGDRGFEYLSLQGNYAPIPVPDGAWTLAEKTYGQTPLYKNGSARLWDVGDQVVCLELTSKMNSIDPDVLKAIVKSLALVRKQGYRGMIIGGDADNFSVGANIGFILYAANMAGWSIIDDVLKQGQDAMMAMKYAPFPVISALGGMALGGGCEIVLHSDAVQAHVESYAGLVEVGVGVIPGWGGCKELLARYGAGARAIAAKHGMPDNGSVIPPGGPMPVVAKAFETISMAKVAESAEQAQEMGILNPASRITMNRRRLLADAKALCLEMADGYTPPEPPVFGLPGPSGREALNMAVEGFVQSGKATAHDEVVSKKLAEVLTGGECDMHDVLTEQDILDLERAKFLDLVRTKGTLARIEHMLNTGKPLRN